MVKLNRPLYKNAPVTKVSTLAEALRLTEPQLYGITQSASKSYGYRPQKKKDGTVRDTWDAQPQLKKVQEFINRRFLTKVLYPLYLQGGIKDLETPRDYVRNVAIHSGASCAVALDIANYFPSISSKQVHSVWRNVFRFPEEVAAFLTELTCKDGAVPQGAKTSSYIANLIFWENECHLVSKLEALGWAYSRLTDDITVSKRTSPSHEELQKVAGMVMHFIRSHGFSVKREKFQILWQSQPMKLNGILANAHPALTKTERNSIRGKVRWLSQVIMTNTPIDSSELHHVMGKLGKLKRLHIRQGVLLRMSLPLKLEASTKFIKQETTPEANP